jgi:hypothetical protein
MWDYILPGADPEMLLEQFIVSDQIYILGCARSLIKARTEAGSWTKVLFKWYWEHVNDE